MLSLPPGAYMGTPLCPNWRKRLNTSMEMDEFSKERIEAVLQDCVKCVQGELSFANAFPYRDLLQILHRAADLFESEPMLIEVTSPRYAVNIIGQLYGDALQLFRILHYFGTSTESYCVFLGDYVGFGTHQLELLAFLLALKIRFRKRIILLRGANEVLYDLKNNRKFFSEVQKTFPHWQRMFLEFHRVFDLMPVAAIIGDNLLLNGGVSQWMTTRNAIRNIPRPTYFKGMKFLHGCILADIFYGRPTHPREQVAASSLYGVIDDMFYPSKTHSAGYDFGLNGLLEILQQLACSKLIRSGSELCCDGGCNDFFGNGRCYEITSTAGSSHDYCAVIQLFYDREGVLRSEQSVHFTYIRPHLEKESICNAMFQTLTCLLQNVPYSPFQQFQNPCRRCNYIISHSFAFHEFGARIASHKDQCDWMLKDGSHFLADDRTYQLTVHCRKGQNIKMRQLEMFPVCYDMLDTAGLGMYRSMITTYERPILARYFDSYRYADPDVKLLEHCDARFDNVSVGEVHWKDFSSSKPTKTGLYNEKQKVDKYIRKPCNMSKRTVPVYGFPQHAHFEPARQTSTIFRTQQVTTYPVLRKVNPNKGCAKKTSDKTLEIGIASSPCFTVRRLADKLRFKRRRNGNRTSLRSTNRSIRDVLKMSQSKSYHDPWI